MKKYIAIFSVLVLLLLAGSASAGVKIKFNNNDTDDGIFVGSGSSASQLYVHNKNVADIDLSTVNMSSSGTNVVMVGEDSNNVDIETDDAEATTSVTEDVNTTIVTYEVPADDSVELEASGNVGDDSLYTLTGAEAESEIFDNDNFVDSDETHFSAGNSGFNLVGVGEDSEGTISVKTGKSTSDVTKAFSYNWTEVHRYVGPAPSSP